MISESIPQPPFTEQGTLSDLFDFFDWSNQEELHDNDLAKSSSPKTNRTLAIAAICGQGDWNKQEQPPRSRHQRCHSDPTCLGHFLLEEERDHGENRRKKHRRHKKHHRDHKESDETNKEEYTILGGDERTLFSLDGSSGVCSVVLTTKSEGNNHKKKKNRRRTHRKKSKKGYHGRHHMKPTRLFRSKSVPNMKIMQEGQQVRKRKHARKNNVSRTSMFVTQKEMEEATSHSVRPASLQIIDRVRSRFWY